MAVSMRSIEVGTIGGGTVLGPRGSVLEMLGIKGAHRNSPGQNAQRLACIIATSIMAGELSLLSALAARHLMCTHLVHNCSQANTPMSLRPVTPGLIASDIVWRQRTAEKSLGPAPEPVLSHSLSTTSLLSRSLLSCKGSYIWLLIPAGKLSTGAGAGAGFCWVRVRVWVWPLIPWGLSLQFPTWSGFSLDGLAQAPNVLSSPACPGTLYSLHVTRSY